MEIMKVFSSYDDYGYEDERLYSVLMSEEELTLFSEIQKEFAFKDYKGLTKEQAKALKEFRHQEAVRLNNYRKKNNTYLMGGVYDSKAHIYDTKDAYSNRLGLNKFDSHVYGEEGAKKLSRDKAIKASIDEANKRSSRVREALVRGNKIKKAAKIGAVTAALAGLGYGAKKLYDKNKNKKKEQ